MGRNGNLFIKSKEIFSKPWGLDEQPFGLIRIQNIIYSLRLQKILTSQNLQQHLRDRRLNVRAHGEGMRRVLAE